MMKLVAQFIFFLTGWKQVGTYPKELKKSVMIAAPHTSNWDFLFARAAFFIMDIPVKVTVKKESFKGPMKFLLNWFGAIPIDRNRKADTLNKKNNMVNAMIELFERDELVVLITPEGTRNYAPRWKTGFYHLAVGAKVPIVLGYLDYKEKHAGIGPVIYPTGNLEEDLETIMAFYRTKTGKYPEKGIR